MWCWLFQYILCYGSTSILQELQKGNDWFQYILCYGSTKNKGRKCTVWREFQYILCYGSTRRRCVFHRIIIYFNTSYVTVQHILSIVCRISETYFNTSYVTVQQINWPQIYLVHNNFNTSYVTVQLDWYWRFWKCIDISIHPMLRFN